jgi:UDP-glucose 4-epimerase
MVTGGLGFIGSNLVHKLVELEANVLIIDCVMPNQGGNPFNIHSIRDKVKVYFVDIRDKRAMNKLVKEQNFIFNLAAQLSHIRSMTDPFTDLDINCRGHLTLLEACKKHNRGVRIVYTGTRGQYGRVKYLPVDEKHPMKPIDTNGITKMAGEQYHLLYNDAYGIRSSSLRLTNTYGPRHQMKNCEQGFVNWFIRKAIDGETIKIFGEGKQKRDLNFVSDAVSAILFVGAINSSAGKVYNIGSGVSTSITDIAKWIVEIAGNGSYEFTPTPKDRTIIEVGDYFSDITKIKKLGWSPQIGLKEGLEKTIEFYTKNREKYWN